MLVSGVRCITLVLTAILGSTAVVHAQSRTVLVGATLIDGTGAPPRPGSRIVIEHGRIVCVSGPDGCAAVPGDRSVALVGRWVTPGFIDTHIHLPLADDPTAAARVQRLRFALGITATRDADTHAVEQLLALRDGAEEATRPIPRIAVAALVAPAYAESLGAPLVTPLVERLAAMGVDAIKIKGSERWREEVRAARSVGLPAYGHTWRAPARPFIREALAEGVSGITHLMAFGMESQPPGSDSVPPKAPTDVWRWYKDLWLTASRPLLDSLAREIIAKGVWLEPTLAAEFHWGNAPWIPPSHNFLRQPARLRDLVALGSSSTVREAKYPEPWIRQAAFVGDFIRRGGIVLAGSDDLEPGIDMHEEIRLIGEVAGSPLAGLLAATRNAAMALGRADLGTVEVGRLADLVVFDVDPLGGPMATLSITDVIKGGVIHDADTLLAEFRAEHRVLTSAVRRGRLLKAGLVAAAMLILGLGVFVRTRRSA